MSKILLTSFQTWLPHHTSNASDDLLVEIQNQSIPHSSGVESHPLSLGFVRQLPVEVTPATKQVIAKIESFNPDMIICCGMAEKRSHLTIESNATWESHCLETSVNLEKIITGLIQTTISHDAGKFVCEGLYYQILNYLQQSQLPSQCIFVHVPILTPENLSEVLADFQQLILNFHLIFYGNDSSSTVS